MTDLRWVIERLECEDWEVGPFDGHCLRLTCKRCILARVEDDLEAKTAALARAEQYARRLEDEIVFRLHDEILALAEDDQHRESPELREAAMTAYTGATERWQEMFAASPLAAAASPAPAAERNRPPICGNCNRPHDGSDEGCACSDAECEYWDSASAADASGGR